MLKSLFKDSFLYTLSSSLGQLIGFIMLPIYTRILTTEDYGVLSLLLLMIVLLQLMVSMQLDQAVARFYVLAKSEKIRLSISSTGFIYYLIVFFIIALCFYIFADEIIILVLNKLDKNYLLAIQLLGANLFSLALFSFQLNMLKWKRQSKTMAVFSIANAVLTPLFVAYFIIYLKLGVAGVILGQMLSQLLLLPFSFYYLKGIYCWRYVSLHQLKKMLIFAGPLTVGAISIYAMQYTDRIIISRYLSLSDLGIYSLAVRLGSIIIFLLNGFKIAWGPFIYEQHAKKETREVISLIFKTLIVSSLFVILVTALFSKEIIYLLATPNYLAASSVVPLIMASNLVFTIGGYFSMGMNLARKTHITMWINLAAVCMNIIITIFCVQEWGIIGAGIALFFTLLVWMIISLYYSYQFYIIPYQLKSFSSICLVFLSCLLSGIYFFSYSVTIGHVFDKVVLVIVFALYLYFYSLPTIKKLKVHFL